MQIKSPILRLALPSIVANITVPLLGLIDTAITGHLGSSVYIAAIALGGMMFNMVYWLFNFLRMGTGGLTAQAYGAEKNDEAVRVLLRSLILGGGIAALFILLQEPILHLTFTFVETDATLMATARTYFHILVWGAPAVLGMYCFTGWFLGMQNARYPMWISILQNLINIVVSLMLVFGLGWKIEGVACGTLVAQYAGLGMAIILCRKRYGRLFRRESFHGLGDKGTWKQFFAINRNIFLRTLCLVGVTTCFTATGTSYGPDILAANALLMQLFILYSYFMDGFAFAGEAIGGRCVGQGNLEEFRRTTSRLFRIGIGCAAIFALLYVIFGTEFLHLLTDESEVVETARRWLPAACLIPAVSLAAFLFDGLFIGATATKEMLISMATATTVFFLLVQFLPAGNTVLWTAFLAYLGMRGIIQALLYPGVVRKSFTTRKGKEPQQGVVGSDKID